MTDQPASRGGTVDAIRKALAAATTTLTIAELLALCPIARDTTQVATLLIGELSAGRVQREGCRGAYRYGITVDGMRAAANPKSLRSAKHRRTRDKRIPRPSILQESAMARHTASTTLRRLKSVGPVAEVDDTARAIVERIHSTSGYAPPVVVIVVDGVVYAPREGTQVAERAQAADIVGVYSHTAKSEDIAADLVEWRTSACA